MPSSRLYTACGRLARPIIVLIALGAFLALLEAPAGARAQATEPGGEQPPDARTESLRRGTPASFDGVLVEPALLVWFRQRIERLEFRLSTDLAREAERQAVLLRLEQARTTAAEDRLRLHEGLWRDRLRDAAARLARAQRDLTDARRPSVWARPILWYGLGILTTVLLVAAGAIAFS